jgi:hypothetical protein
MLRADLRERSGERRVIQLKARGVQMLAMSPGSATIQVFPQQRIVFVSHRDV